ncbi:MAG: GntR family transcriptional regulator [Cyanobacteria bacterium P01_H01_bin.35]
MHRQDLPIYTQIVEELRQNIQQGVYQVGDKLPTEAQLNEYFAVNRHTLRRAIAILKSDIMSAGIGARKSWGNI